MLALLICLLDYLVQTKLVPAVQSSAIILLFQGFEVALFAIQLVKSFLLQFLIYNHCIY